MLETVNQIINQSFGPNLLFWVGLLMLLNSSIMIPPSEHICITAGIVSTANSGSLWEIIIVATVANYLGTHTWYELGRRHSKSGIRLQSMQFKNQTIQLITNIYLKFLPKIESYYQTKGSAAVFFLRLVPLLRSIASYPAGILRLQRSSFLVASIIGIGIWVTLWVMIGHYLAKHAYEYSLPIALILGLSSFLALSFYETKHEEIQ